MIEINLIIAFILLAIATYSDIRWREVADWLNYAGIAVGLGIFLIYSLVSFSFTPILKSLTGLVIFSLIGVLLYYTGQWGGGDAKNLMALGTLIGLSFDFNAFGVAFLFNAIFASAAYGLISTLFLTIKNFKKIKLTIPKIANLKFLKILISIFFISVFLAFVIFPYPIDFLFSAIFFVALLLFLLSILIKVIEKVAFLKRVAPEELTEGDWIAKEIKIDGKTICGPKDLGISKEKINYLIKLKKQGKIKRVLIKTGIPFIPSFLFSFIFTLIFGNIFYKILLLY